MTQVIFLPSTERPFPSFCCGFSLLWAACCWTNGSFMIYLILLWKIACLIWQWWCLFDILLRGDPFCSFGNFAAATAFQRRWPLLLAVCLISDFCDLFFDLGCDIHILGQFCNFYSYSFVICFWFWQYATANMWQCRDPSDPLTCADVILFYFEIKLRIFSEEKNIYIEINN